MWKIPKRVAYASVCLVLASGVAMPVVAQEKTVVARDAWMRPPAPSKDDTALFVVLENRSAQKRAVVGGSSDAAAKLELHEMKMSGNMMAMGPVAQIAIPAHGKAELRPGGYHVMVFGLKTRPAIGDSVAVVLTLDDGTKLPVTATVRK